MSEPEQNIVLAELKAMRKQLVTIGNLVHGLYRRAKGMPTQQPLPGLAPDDTRDAPEGLEWTMPQPGAIARNLPRRWSNTVKVYDALWEVFGDRPFGSEDLFGEEAREAVRKATNGRIKPQTVARMMTALRRARAAGKVLRSNGRWFLREPTDALREAVEAEADRLNAHKPKEAADA